MSIVGCLELFNSGRGRKTLRNPFKPTTPTCYLLRDRSVKYVIPSNILFLNKWQSSNYIINFEGYLLYPLINFVLLNFQWIWIFFYLSYIFFNVLITWKIILIGDVRLFFCFCFEGCYVNIFWRNKNWCKGGCVVIVTCLIRQVVLLLCVASVDRRRFFVFILRSVVALRSSVHSDERGYCTWVSC